MTEKTQPGQQPPPAHCQSPRSYPILQGQSSSSTACQISLKTENIHKPSQMQQFFKLLTSIFFFINILLLEN